MDSSRTPTSIDSGPSRRRRPTRKLLLVVLAALVLAVAAGGVYGAWYILIGPPSPATVTGAAIPSGASVPAPASLDGTWQVNDSLGSFGDFSSSWAGYQVKEQFAGIGGHTAVGRTPKVTGSMTLTGANASDVQITADLMALVSDDARRDGELGDLGIETNKFPTAVFKTTQPIVLTLPSEGQIVSVTASGTLTLHGVTKNVQIALQAQRQGGIVGVSGSVSIVFADYGFKGPTSLLVVSVEDHGIMEIHLLFTHA
jgi:polyisoprenoid-binding protein YceI